MPGSQNETELFRYLAASFQRRNREAGMRCSMEERFPAVLYADQEGCY
jgi:hypothetical protein